MVEPARLPVRTTELLTRYKGAFQPFFCMESPSTLEDGDREKLGKAVNDRWLEESSGESSMRFRGSWLMLFPFPGAAGMISCS